MKLVDYPSPCLEILDFSRKSSYFQSMLLKIYNIQSLDLKSFILKAKNVLFQTKIYPIKNSFVENIKPLSGNTWNFNLSSFTQNLYQKYTTSNSKFITLEFLSCKSQTHLLSESLFKNPISFSFCSNKCHSFIILIFKLKFHSRLKILNTRSRF